MIMLVKGFRFGMLLQIAVGPICFFIFQTASISGFITAEIGVTGVVLIDGIYILAAILVIGAVLNKYNKAKKFIKYLGAFILIIFGISNIAGAFHINFLPGLNFNTDDTGNNIFLKTLLLTLSNPLTMLFWAGVFSTKIAEEDMKKKSMYSFGIGALLSTLLFLSAIAFLGSFINTYLSTSVTNILNIAVGLLLIFFGIRTAFKKI